MENFKIQWMPAVLLLALFTLGGCAAPTNEDKIGDAQFCLDELPVTGLTAAQRSTAVNTCLSKISGVTSKQASLLHCAGNFLIEGFGDPTKLVSALDRVNQQNNGGTVAMMSVLAFTSQNDAAKTTQENADANSAFAETTMSYCQQAGNPGYVLIASFARIATSLTTIASVNLSDGLSQSEVNTIMTQSPEVIGAAAVVAYQTSCSGGETSNAQLCQELGTAMQNGATPAQIGQALLDTWKTPSP